MTRDMFCFVTPLRSPQLSDNWPRICELFERTAISVFRQSIPDFRQIVVCHERPTMNQSFDQRLEFITVDLPVPRKSPRSSRLAHIDHPAMERDKLSKLTIGLRRARELNASFVMLLDADDLVSSRLVAHVLSNPGADGWFVERGWRYEYGRRWVETVDGFNKVCSSCNVLARRWFTFPGQPERERDAEAALILQGHGQAVEAFAARGALLRPFPFRAVVYTVYGGGMSLQLYEDQPRLPRRNPLRRFAGRSLLALNTWMHRRPCSASIRREFAIDRSVPAGLQYIERRTSDAGAIATT
jgi:hypothetical protein